MPLGKHFTCEILEIVNTDSNWADFLVGLRWKNNETEGKPRARSV